MPRHRLAVVSLACCLAAGSAACDSGPSIDPDADEELIEDALLTVDDLPEGFEEVDDDDDEDRLGAACNEEILDIDRDALDDATSADAGPAQFDSAEGNVSVRAEIRAFEDADDITRIVEAVEDEDYLDCLAESLEDELEQGTTLVGIEAVDTPFEDREAVVGGLGVTLEVNSPATSGLVVEIESQQHVVVLDRFAITLQMTAEAGQVDEALVEDLIETMVDRLEDGLEDQ